MPLISWTLQSGSEQSLFIENCRLFASTLLKLVPEFVRIAAILLVGPLFSLLRPPGTASVGLSLSAIIRMAFSHQWEAPKKVPNHFVAAEESR
jgi:hypothetical protein